MTFTLINASAGSGKTYTLTRELAERIAEGLDPSQVVATTFTVKAAAELAQRVRSTLLDRRQIEAARGIDSAVIGTVNAVAGRLVQEYALDAGISPEVEVLDDTTQRTAFSAAIARTAAATGARWADLLARTEHDGEEREPGSSFRGATSESWQAQVRRVADAARVNLLGADDLRAAAEPSWQEMREAAALPEPGEDLRGRWLHELDARIGDVEAEIAASVGPGGEPVAGGPIRKNSLARTQRAVEELQVLRRRLADLERAPWSRWRKLAAGGFGAVADRLLEPLSTEVAEGLPANPVWQQDVQDLVALVLGTAADSLDAYAAYKRELGLMDFIDQEVQALRLLQGSERVRESVRSRFRLLAVDEFQDTSPIQLALFLELSRLIEDKIWVGDPKQAIYGFRDADPRLMADIVTALEDGGTVFGRGEVQNLSHSWRSQERLIAFSNALFSRVFAPDGGDTSRITLAVPPQRAEAAAGGGLAVWQAVQSRGGVISLTKQAAMVAEGIRERVASGAASPGRTAVLVRTNSQRDAVVAALQERGVPTAGAAHPLLAAREAQIVRAGLAVALDGTDTLALTELVTLLEDHGAHEDWFAQLMAAPDAEARRSVLERWWEDPVLAGLREVRAACIAFTPTEMITALVEALDLPQRIRRRGDQESRRRTLDALRAFAEASATRRRAAGSAVTLSGLRADLDAWEEEPDLSGLADAVWVGTVHAAKGLEWDEVVTLLPPPPKERDLSSGVLVTSPGAIDVVAPLAGRRLRFWPKLAVPAEVAEGLAASDFATRRAASEAEEAGRLHYVALTRAARTGVLAVAGAATVLDPLVAEGPAVTGAGGGAGGTLPVPGGGAAADVTLPATVRRVAVDELLEDAPQRLEQLADPLAATDVPLRPDPGAAARVGARFQASGVGSDAALGSVGAPRRIGPSLVTGGGPQWERVGEAVHAYLALPLAELDPAQRETAAQRLIGRWQVARTVDAAVLHRAGEAWAVFLAEEFPGAERLTEQPITWWNEDAQVMEGWIDTLLRLPSGEVVLVDHKSYPGEDPVGHVREHYLGQMATYARALAAAGAEPSRILIHLPLRGEVLEVTLHAR